MYRHLARVASYLWHNAISAVIFDASNPQSSRASSSSSSNADVSAVSGILSSSFPLPETYKSFSSAGFDATVPSAESAIRMIADAAAAKGELAIASLELDRKSAQLEALNKLVMYLKLHSTLFTAAPVPLSSVAPSAQQSLSSTVDALREALSARSVEVDFWRASHEQMATALVFAEEELRMQTAARTKCEEQMRSSSSASAIALATADNRYSALQEQAGDLIAQTEELSRIIDAKNDELRVLSRTHSEYVQSSTQLLEQQELALAEFQRHTTSFPSHQHSSSSASGEVFNRGSSLNFSNENDIALVQTLRLQVQELEEQLLLQPRVTRPNLNPSYQPSSSTSPAARVSASDYMPPPLPPSELLDEVGFSFANAGTMISLASSDPTSLVATVSTSLDELGRFVISDSPLICTTLFFVL